MAFGGLFDFSSKSETSTTVNETVNTDSNNRVTNNVRNLSESGNVTVTIPGQDAKPAAAVSLSAVAPALVGALITIAGTALLIKRR